MNTHIFSLLACLVLSAGLLAQTTDLPATMSRELVSPNPGERAQGFKELVAAPTLLKTSAGVRAIVNLLQRETRIVEDTFRESGGQLGVSDKYGEGYSEYYADLLGTLDTIGNKNDPEVLDALVNASYNADSVFAVKLARAKALQILPAVLDLCKNPLSPSRMKGVQMLGTIVHENKALPDVLKNKIQAAAIAALTDSGAGVRQSGVSVLGEIGDSSSIPQLDGVAKDDQGVLLDSGERRYFVREASQKAIAKIKERSPR